MSTLLNVIAADQLQSALNGLSQQTAQAATVAGIKSIGRAPAAGDPAGLYRFADSSGTVDIAWNGSAETGRTPVLATFTQIERARNATLTVITLEQFGAPNDFDPAYANSVYSTSGWATYLASKNASLAFAQALAYAQAHPGTTLRAGGNYYLGPLDGASQRLYGRLIYGPNTNLHSTTDPTYRAVYEAMPVVGERLNNFTFEGAGATFYQGEGCDTLMAFYECDGVFFTGQAKCLGFTPKTVTTDTENQALIRIGIGTKHWSIGAGWSLGAFLGDGVNIGGTRTDFGSDDPAHAAYTGRVYASIRERYGNGQRPWQGADGSLTPAAGAAHGTKSRLAVSIIHAVDVRIESQEIYGAVDIEPNTAAQLIVDVFVENARLRGLGIVPLPGGAHPWQEEALTLPGAGGSVELEVYIASNSPQLAVAAGGGLRNLVMDKGYIYVHDKMWLPIENVTFTVAGHISWGNLGDDTGKTTDGGSVRNVRAPTVYQRLLYGQTVTPTTVSSLVFLSGNVRNLTVADCQVEDANFATIGINPVPNHTGGNSEQSGRYISNKNTGLGGAGKVVGFTPHATSVQLGSRSAADTLDAPVNVLHYNEKAVTLDAAGKITWATTQASSYVLTPNASRGDNNFYGFTDGGNVPAGTRITVRAAAGTTIVMVSSAGIYTRTAKSFATDEYREVEFIVIGGQLVEQNRAIAGTGAVTNVDLTATLTVSNPPTQAEVTAIRDRANTTATVLNSLLANLRNGGVIEP